VSLKPVTTHKDEEEDEEGREEGVKGVEGGARNNATSKSRKGESMEEGGREE